LENSSKFRYLQEKEEAEKKNKEAINRTKRGSTMIIRGSAPVMGNIIKSSSNSNFGPLKSGGTEESSVKQFMQSLKKSGLANTSYGLSSSHGNLKSTPSGRVMPVNSLNNQNSQQNDSMGIRRSTSFTGINNIQPTHFTNPILKSNIESPVASPNGNRKTNVNNTSPQHEEAQRSSANPFANIYKNMLKQVEEEDKNQNQPITQTQPPLEKSEVKSEIKSEVKPVEKKEEKKEEIIEEKKEEIIEEKLEEKNAPVDDGFKYEVVPIIFESDAKSCSLMGTFNNWIPQPMNREGESFVCEITIEKGTHHAYKFVVNGSTLMHNTNAPNVTDTFGNTNNIIN